MSAHLSLTDLARLEAASRALLAPLTATDPQAWLREAGRAVRDLVGGAGVVLQYGTGPTPFVSDDARTPPACRGSARPCSPRASGSPTR